MKSNIFKEAQKKLKGKPMATDEESEKYPELFIFMYDSSYEASERRRGLSTLNKDAYLRILKKYQDGYYPKHLRHLAISELQLKHQEVSEEQYKEILAMIERDENENS